MKSAQVLEAEASTPSQGPAATPEPVVASAWSRTGGRLFDLVVIACVAPIALPLGLAVFALNALAFRSLRRAFFFQERMGLDEKPFWLWKFRTMDSIGPSRLPWSPSSDAERVTRLGRFLRSTHLDELPQLGNVLSGRMRLIGPRPEMLEVHEWACKVVPGFERQLAVPPGLTGPAQVRQGYVGRDIEGYERKHQLNLEYVANANFWGDVALVGRTLFWMVAGRGWNWRERVEPPE